MPDSFHDLRSKSLSLVPIRLWVKFMNIIKRNLVVDLRKIYITYVTLSFVDAHSYTSENVPDICLRAETKANEQLSAALAYGRTKFLSEYFCCNYWYKSLPSSLLVLYLRSRLQITKPLYEARHCQHASDNTRQLHNTWGRIP